VARHLLVNVPVGAVALWLGWKYMPYYRNESPQPSGRRRSRAVSAPARPCCRGCSKSSCEHDLPGLQMVVLPGAGHDAAARLRLARDAGALPAAAPDVFRVRTFRVSVLGGFVTRLGIGGMPFLLPLLYSSASGCRPGNRACLMMPSAARRCS